MPARPLALALALAALPAAAQTSVPSPRERYAAHAAACQRPPAPADTAAADPVLRRELLALEAADQADRAFTSTLGTEPPPDALVRRLLHGDSLRTTRLRAIVAAHGWPTAALVGRDGVHAAFLLLQHATDPVLQALLLPDLVAAYARGEVDGDAVALLTDRARLHAGLPQRYGTQGELRGDHYAVREPLEDPAGLDARRASLCLLPIDLYLMGMEEVYGLRDHGLFDD
jgi:hypothetical protein